jgi:hypothetical protein
MMLAWAAGLAGVAGGVSLARIVGPGFTWLTAGTAGALGLVGLGLQGWGSRAALVLVVLGAALARHHRPAGFLLIAASAGYFLDATSLGGPALALTAALALGGVTGEMALGHWYLIDPRLPRSALRALAMVGIVGLIADGMVLWSLGDLTWSGAVVAYVALLVTSTLLMFAVLGALRQPAYSGVMAATGLSYLAVLTTLGAMFLGRALVSGIGPFAN